MAMLPDVFVPEDADENPFAPIPAGWYLAELTKSELNTTNDKQGKYLSFAFQVLEGDYKNRIIYTNINIVNRSDTAVKIGRADLKGICMSVGHEGELEDTEDLHNIPMAIKVTIKAETSQWPAKNEIKSYKPEDYLEEEKVNRELDNPKD